MPAESLTNSNHVARDMHISGARMKVTYLRTNLTQMSKLLLRRSGYTFKAKRQVAN